MSACERGRAWEQALQVEAADGFFFGFSEPNVEIATQVFNSMHASKIAGDVVAFNAALSALDRGSQWQEDQFLL